MTKTIFLEFEGEGLAMGSKPLTPDSELKSSIDRALAALPEDKEVVVAVGSVDLDQQRAQATRDRRNDLYSARFGAYDVQRRAQRGKGKRRLLKGNTHLPAIEIPTRPMVALFPTVNDRQRTVLERVIPRLLHTIDEVNVQVQADALKDQVKALTLLYPEVKPTLDPRVERISDAMALQRDFMRSEAVLQSAGIAKRAGFSIKNPSHTASRWRTQGKIFSVSYYGKDYFPAFQFTDHGQPQALMKDILATLRRDEEMTDWDIALWFVSANSWLSGETPRDLIGIDSKDNRARLLRAAEQEVAREDA